MRQLHPEVAAKYALIGIRPGKYNFKGFGEIDLCTLSVAKADSLVNNGFPHLKLRAGVTPAAPVPEGKKDLKVKEIKLPDQPASEKEPDSSDLRANKLLVNKLLTMNWKDLSHKEKGIFFHSETYFLEKKTVFLNIVDIDRQMKSYHANAKALAKDPKKKGELKLIMGNIAAEEDKKVELWARIDTWSDPSDMNKVAEDAAKKAIEKDKLIKAHGNYIYRAELVLDKMPVKTDAEKKRKEEKQKEVKRRKQELIDLGVPYDRKSRK